MIPSIPEGKHLGGLLLSRPNTHAPKGINLINRHCTHAKVKGEGEKVGTLPSSDFSTKVGIRDKASGVEGRELEADP